MTTEKTPDERTRADEGAPPAKARGRRAAGVTLVEVLLATGILLLSSLSLAYAFTSTELSSRNSTRAVASRTSLETVYETVADVAYEQLLGWNGVLVDRGDHSVVVTTSLVQVGLILVNLRVVDDTTGVELGRLATLRASET